MPGEEKLSQFWLWLLLLLCLVPCSILCGRREKRGHTGTAKTLGFFPIKVHNA